MQEGDLSRDRFAADNWRRTAGQERTTVNLMNFSTTVEHSVALGTEQKSIWCYSGIDLYVSLQIDETESARVDGLSAWAGSDAPRPAQLKTHPLVTPPADVIAQTLHNGERSTQPEISLEASTSRSRIVEETRPLEASAARSRIEENASAPVAPSELDKLGGEGRALARMRGEQICGQGEHFGRARRNLPGVAVRRFIARFVAPLAVQRDEPTCLRSSAHTSSADRESQEWDDQAGERSSEDDHEKVCDLEDQCRPSKYEFSSRSRNVVKGCLSLANNDDLGETRVLRQQDLEDQPNDQTLTNEVFDSCDENRSWSPEVEDYSWVSGHMSRDLDNQLTRWSEGSTDGREGLNHELDQGCHDMPSSFRAEKDVAGRMLQLNHTGNPSLDAFITSKFPGIESFDVAEILAACQLVKMSAFDCVKDCSQHLSGTTEYDVHNLEFRGEFHEERLSTRIGTMYGSLPNIDFHNLKGSSQPRVGKLDLSPWSDEERYIPRIARRARGRLRGSQFSTRIDFGNREVDDDSDCEVSQRPPRKRQYKSTQELLLA